MRVSDLGAVEALGSEFHVEHPEGAGIAPERLRLAPEWCFVAEDEDGGFGGYCVAHPWGGDVPPGLDRLIHTIPRPADTLHLHDVVLAAALRRGGMGGALLARLMAQAEQAGLSRITLVAVGQAGPYWSRRGFVPDTDPRRCAFVTHSYGEDSTPMLRRLATATA